MTMTIDEALDHVQVEDPHMFDDGVPGLPKGWWGVSFADLGVTAAFNNERDALRFRLDAINLLLNGSQLGIDA